jgi:hypothetical protein
MILCTACWGHAIRHDREQPVDVKNVQVGDVCERCGRVYRHPGGDERFVPTWFDASAVEALKGAVDGRGSG